MFHVKHTINSHNTIKILLSIVLSTTVWTNCYSKKKAKLISNKSIELTVQEQLQEHDRLCYTFYNIGECDKNMDDCIATLLKELKDDLKYYNGKTIILNGHSNIDEIERKAVRRSKQDAVWIAHQLRNLGIDSEIIIKGKGNKEPYIKENKIRFPERLNNRVEINFE